MKRAKVPAPGQDKRPAARQRLPARCAAGARCPHDLGRDERRRQGQTAGVARSVLSASCGRGSGSPPRRSRRRCAGRTCRPLPRLAVPGAPVLVGQVPCTEVQDLGAAAAGSGNGGSSRSAPRCDEALGGAGDAGVRVKVTGDRCYGGHVHGGHMEVEAPGEDLASSRGGVQCVAAERNSGARHLEFADDDGVRVGGCSALADQRLVGSGFVPGLGCVD
jgi:hypothetical protein